MTVRLTATAVRRDAIARLIALADDGPYDPDRMRRDSIDVLYRKALRQGVATGDPAIQPTADILMAVIADRPAGSLYDAVQAGGVGALLGEADVLRPAATLDEVTGALADLLGGAA